MTGEWKNVPVGLDAQRWVTRGGCSVVLAVVHTVASGQRLLDVLEQIECDSRVQVVFTQAPDVFGNGVEEFLRTSGALVLSWQQAVHERFDLVLAAAYGGIHELHGPVMVLPHGAGYAKHVPVAGDGVPPCGQLVYGLDRQRLVRDGRLIPTAVVLSHLDQLAVLARQCPEAVPVAVVAGDPCYDRLLVSMSRRAEYRQALGISERHQLVAVTSTWGRQSLFHQRFEVLPQLLDELPAGKYRVAALLHPAAWFGHGPRQVRAWLADCREGGLILVDPDIDWRAALVAADYVIGDCGSTTVYAAAARRPVLLTDLPLEVDTDSAHALLGRTAPRLLHAKPLTVQLRRAAAKWEAASFDAIAAKVTSRPGDAARLLRSAMYKLLGLIEPGRHRRIAPVAIPKFDDYRELRYG